MNKAKSQLPSKVLVVHSGSEELKESALKSLEKIGLEHLLITGETEARAALIKDIDKEDTPFALFLLYAEDVVAPRDRFPKEAQLKASQEVVFDLGYLSSKLGIDNVFILYLKEGNCGFPYDESLGLEYVAYDESGRWQFDFIKSLKQCGYDVDANKLL